MVQQTNHSWSEITSDLLDTWMETSTKVWKNWLDVATSVSPPNLVAQAKPDFKDLTQRFVDNQDLLLRFYKLSFQAWLDIVPKVQAGQDWQQTLDNYSEQIQTQVKDYYSKSLKISGDVSQLWQLYFQEVQKLNQLWTASISSFFKPMGKAVGGTTEPWIELNNLYWNFLYEETSGSLMQSPILGPTREFSGKVLRGFDSWVTLYRASLDYQVILGDIQVRSFQQLIKELVSLAEKGQVVKDWRQFQQVWSRVADDVFEKAFCSDENLKIRGNFVNALNTYRVYQQDLREMWMKAMDIPSRREVDEIHKTIYELRKEVKTLKKTCAQYEEKLSQYAHRLDLHEGRLNQGEEKLGQYEAQLSQYNGTFSQDQEKLSQYEGWLKYHDEKLGQHDERLNLHEGRFNQQEEKLGQQEEKLEQHDSRFTQQEYQVNQHQDKLAQDENRLNQYEGWLRYHDERLGQINPNNQ